jgi:hypothetical protein
MKPLKQNNKKNRQANRLVKSAACLGAITVCTLYFSEAAYANDVFDFDAGVKAAIDPVVSVISNHWGKGLILGAVLGLVFGSGDGVISRKKNEQNN